MVDGASQAKDIVMIVIDLMQVKGLVNVYVEIASPYHLEPDMVSSYLHPHLVANRGPYLDYALFLCRVGEEQMEAGVGFDVPQASADVGAR